MKHYIYFSATNTTEKVMRALGADKDNSLNITLRQPADARLSFAADDLIYIAFPVFGGRVPAIVLDRLNSLKGNGCKAVVVAVYGNRHYDDSLKEMQAFAESRGCAVVAAIAAVAQHSIAPTIGAGRPDAADIESLSKIGADIDSRLLSGTLVPLVFRPQETYMEYRPLPIHPDSTDDCTLCGVCENQCPVDAISISDRCVTDPSRCIICMRCVAVCPSGARSLPAEVLQAVTTRLESKCPVRREIEVFFSES